ncbi:MAG: hypothetical protein J6U42_04140 [Lachnospiraceae bacterium]|nr:hypothetical protein [Lachnospiraceae bacterium]
MKITEIKKRIYILFAVLVLSPVLFVGCAYISRILQDIVSDSTPVPVATDTPTPVPAVTDTPAPTASPAATDTPSPAPTVTSTPTPKPTATSTPTPNPTATNTPTPKPTATSTPTPKPKATKTPTPKPAKTPTPTPTKASEKAASDAASKFIKTLAVRTNTILNYDSESLYSSRNDAFNGFFRNALDCSSFGMVYRDASCVVAPSEFSSAIPEVYSITVDMENSAVYKNCIYVYYSVKVIYNPQYSYAVRTGDMSVLSGTELAAVKEISRLSDEWKLSTKSDIQKIRTVHDSIISSIAYDNYASAASHTPYGLLSTGLAVCDGYSDTFRIFMLINGIDCITVEGYTDSTSHAWNQVKLDGKWYNIDLTWDDPVGAGARLRYNYFLKSDDYFSKTHKNTSPYAHSCTSAKHLLYFYEDYVCHTRNDVVLKTAAQSQAGYIIITYRSSELSADTVISAVQEGLNGSGFSYSPPDPLDDGYYVLEIVNPNH